MSHEMSFDECAHCHECPGQGRYGITENLSNMEAAFRRYTIMFSAGMEPVMCHRSDGSYRVCYETALKRTQPALAAA